MASCLEQLQIKYKGYTCEVASNIKRTTIVYQGSRELCEQGMNEFQLGDTSTQYGTVRSARIFCDNGPIWNLEVAFEISINAGGTGHTGSDDETYPESSSGPTKSTLTARMMSMPLEYRNNYEARWNHYLFAKKTVSVVPDWWATATTTELSPLNAEYYKWGDSSADNPNPEQWYQMKQPTMPGVSSYDFPVYEITEYEAYSDKKKAGWALHYRAQRICTPLNGDFGIVEKWGGNWLCLGGEIQYDGSRWIASLTYQHSPKGWSTLLYSTD